jgi:hypothetical protein
MMQASLARMPNDVSGYAVVATERGSGRVLAAGQ